MSIAKLITTTNHTATQVRKAAQAQCRSMTRNHRNDKDRYWFGDGSGITVVKHSVYLEGAGQ